MNSNDLRMLINEQSKAISFEEYRIRYATERFLLRLQESKYKENLILKGGFLLGTIFKVEQRTTKDLDTLITEMNADRENVEKMLKEIIEIDLNDGVSFEFMDLQDTQKLRTYEGFKARFKMYFTGEVNHVRFDLDLGVGDTITPDAEIVDIPILFNESKDEEVRILLPAYNLETILAEKTETILVLGTRNTRMKDFYDVHLILNDSQKIDINLFYDAFENTWNFRQSELNIDEERFEDWYYTIDSIMEHKEMNTTIWDNYIKTRSYASNIKLNTIILQFKEYIKKLEQVYIEKNSY